MKSINLMITFQFKTILLLFLLFVNCNNTSSKDDESNILTLEFPENSNNNLISENLSLSNIVVLETVDASLVKHIKRIIKHDDKLIVLNSGIEVLIFNKEGKFINKINKKGNGPKEYTNIVDIALDENNENIIIYSDNFKLLVYDLMGSYVSHVNTITTDKIYERIIYNKDLLYFFNPLNRKDENLIEVFDLKNNEYKENMFSDKSIDFMLRPMGVSIVKSKAIWYVVPLSSQLSNISQQKKYRIDIDNFGVPQNIIDLQYKDQKKFMNEIYGKKLCFGLSSIRETEQSIYFKSNRHDFIKLSKSNNKIEWMQFGVDLENKIKNMNYFPHDADDNEIMFIAKPDSFEDFDLLIENNPSAQQYTKNMQKEEINPILIFYKEK